MSEQASGVWDLVIGLSGQTLETVTGKRFDVVSVDARHVAVRPADSKTPDKPRKIERWKIEDAYTLTPNPSLLTPKQVRDAQISEWHPAYVVGIVRAIARRSS